MDTFYIVLKQLYIYRCLNGQKQRVSLETCDLFDSSYEKNNLHNTLAILATFEFFTMLTTIVFVFVYLYFCICICLSVFEYLYLCSPVECSSIIQFSRGSRQMTVGTRIETRPVAFLLRSRIGMMIKEQLDYLEDLFKILLWQMSLWQYNNLIGQYNAAYRRRMSFLV